MTMKSNLLTKGILGLSIATSAIALSPQSSQAKAIFACDTTNIATTVETQRGAVPIIEWQDSSFAGSVTPQQRCQTASQKLQQLYNNGEIKYIRTDMVNNSPVVCGVSKIESSCLPNGILASLKAEPDMDREHMLPKILDHRIWGLDYEHSYISSSLDKPERIIFQTNKEIHFDLELFLKKTDK